MHVARLLEALVGHLPGHQAVAATAACRQQLLQRQQGMALEQRCLDHGLALDGVQAAGGVDQAAARP